MHPIHDVDALLLLALALSSKRRPAELVEIVAAIDVLQLPLPSESLMINAFSQLAKRGLICAQEGGFTLTPEAQKLLVGGSRKADPEQRIAGIKEKLATYEEKGEHPPIMLTAKQVCTATLEHRAAARLAAKNLLVPKPKPVDGSAQRPGQRQRKPLPARRRKD